MGGSLALALRDSCRSLLAYDPDPDTISLALHNKIVDHASSIPTEIFPQADVIILAAPLKAILDLIQDLPNLHPGSPIVFDIGSSKVEIVHALDGLPARFDPFGGHPMCGKETNGAGEAEPDLYRGCTFILCPLSRTSDAALAFGQEMVEAIGATPLVLDGERQDRLAATLSHLPYLLACALVQTADVTTSDDPAAWEIVAGGFRDTSRVAGSDVHMMLDILATNRTAVLRSAKAFRNGFDRLVELIETGAEDELVEMLTRSREERRRMFR